MLDIDTIIICINRFIYYGVSTIDWHFRREEERVFRKLYYINATMIMRAFIVNDPKIYNLDQ